MKVAFEILPFMDSLPSLSSRGTNGPSGDPARFCCLKLFDLFPFWFCFLLTSFNVSDALHAERRDGLPARGLGVTVLCDGGYVCRTAAATGGGDGRSLRV